MSHLEYCACTHPNDHAGKPCGHIVLQVDTEDSTPEFTALKNASCPCVSGIRIDLATFQLLVDQTRLIDQQNALLAEQCQSLARMLAVLEHSTGLQSRLVDAGNGRARVEVKPKIVLVSG